MTYYWEVRVEDDPEFEVQQGMYKIIFICKCLCNTQEMEKYLMNTSRELKEKRGILR